MNPIPTLYLKAGAAALVIAISFGSGWLTQGWRKDAEIQRLQLSHQRALTASEQQARLAEMLARSTEQKFQQKLQEAQDGARKRETTLRADAAASRAAAGSLRDQLATIRGGLTQASSQARADTAAALAVVLERCSVEYRELAEVADRHASDVRTLIDAWPVQPSR